MRDARATLDARRGRRRETSARGMASTAVTMPSSALGARAVRGESARRTTTTRDVSSRGCIVARANGTTAPRCARVKATCGESDVRSARAMARAAPPRNPRRAAEARRIPPPTFFGSRRCALGVGYTISCVGYTSCVLAPLYLPLPRHQNTRHSVVQD